MPNPLFNPNKTMSEKTREANAGGPAFPNQPCDATGQPIVEAHEGMTLRDYFAARALQMIVINDISGRPEDFREHYSEGAYRWADAMLKARSK